jgi:hypothetical protein
MQAFALRCGHVVVKRTALSRRTFLLGSAWLVQASLVQQRVESGRLCSLTKGGTRHVIQPTRVGV